MAGGRCKIDEINKLRTPEERSKAASIAGSAPKTKVTLRKALEILMETDLTGKDGKTMSGAEAMAVKAFQQALKGDWKAWELVRDTAGQKPVDKVMVADVDPSVIDEVERMVNGEPMDE